MVEPNRPFRWDLVRPDQLGSLLDDVGEPSLFFLDDLIECAARVLAQCADGELYFVDLVFEGSTFGNLYAVLRRWIDDDRAQWDVIRRPLRFIGSTARTKTSPNTWRWQQHAA
ncbi:hypothetical protein ACIBG5_02990 [Kribbella sp. NPDC050241]|uniref:hypothetical protein n=1 Tax=Kribbella sp. NPDC050241 TaxID=3364115 RepID=UPI0037B3A262